MARAAAADRGPWTPQSAWGTDALLLRQGDRARTGHRGGRRRLHGVSSRDPPRLILTRRHGAELFGRGTRALVRCKGGPPCGSSSRRLKGLRVPAGTTSWQGFALTSTTTWRVSAECG